MANQRRAGQSFVGFQGDSHLVAMLDRARAKDRKDRSLFIREAIAEKLSRMGYHVPEEWIVPPLREVKEVMLNEEPSEPLQPLPPRNEVKYKVPKKDPVFSPQKKLPGTR